MDKRKLFRDIAVVRKQLFSLVAFGGFLVVSMATLLGQGMNFYLIFRNSIVSILAFGVIGFIVGKVYAGVVEKPLIESYRGEAKQRIEDLKSMGTQRLAMPISISELSPGMKVVNTVQNKDGALLVRAGAILTERLIQTLRENNVAGIKVEAQKQVPTEEEMANDWKEES